MPIQKDKTIEPIIHEMDSNWNEIQFGIACLKDKVVELKAETVILRNQIDNMQNIINIYIEKYGELE